MGEYTGIAAYAPLHSQASPKLELKWGELIFPGEAIYIVTLGSEIIMRGWHSFSFFPRPLFHYALLLSTTAQLEPVRKVIPATLSECNINSARMTGWAKNSLDNVLSNNVGPNGHIIPRTTLSCNYYEWFLSLDFKTPNKWPANHLHVAIRTDH